MIRYNVDVRAFISLKVDADGPDAARLVAEAFVENCLVANADTVVGYNSGLDANSIGFVVPDDIGPSVDGDTDVERCSTWAIASDLSGTIETEDGFGAFATEREATARLVDLLVGELDSTQSKLDAARKRMEKIVTRSKG